VVDVDHPVRGTAGAEHREPVAVAGDQLQVDAGSRVAQRADELVDESVALHLGHPGDHGQTRVEVEGDGACPALDDESFELHGRGIGRRGPDLESNGPLGRRGGG